MAILFGKRQTYDLAIRQADLPRPLHLHRIERGGIIDPDEHACRRQSALLDLRAGIRSKEWSITAWERDANNELYNAEFSPGGFVFKAKPRRSGLDYTRNF